MNGSRPEADESFYCPGHGCDQASECLRTEHRVLVVDKWYMPLETGVDCPYFLTDYEDD